MNETRSLRQRRAFTIGTLVFDLAFAGFDLATGSFLVLVMVACAAASVVMIWRQTTMIRRREHECRPRPDYDVIARMEREIFGERDEP